MIGANGGDDELDIAQHARSNPYTFATRERKPGLRSDVLCRTPDAIDMWSLSLGEYIV